MLKTINLILIVFISHSLYAGENISSDKDSFAKEYARLGELLEKIDNRQTAIEYKPLIEEELNRINLTQSSGQESFKLLSEDEKKKFIKKYQNNHNHCGEVTKVMNERNRLLLNQEVREELGVLLENLLQ